MNKENIAAAKFEGSTARITRARAKELGSSRGLRPPKPSIKQDQKRVLRSNSKRAAMEENKSTDTATSHLQHKKRAVFKDVTNILRENSYNCMNAARSQIKRGPAKRTAKVAPDTVAETSEVQEDVKTVIAEEVSKTKAVELQKEAMPPQPMTLCNVRECDVPDLMLAKQTPRKPSQLQGPLKKEEDKLHKKSLGSKGLGIADIDSNQKDPQMCSLYATDIYNNLRVAELNLRPSANFMETPQQDITQSMRGILVDWLVEVSEEYKLVPDTLHLTVNLIDRYLSQNHIEKQRLQLLGVTCMLIASKYEEICAPRVEEFCFITDNTYTREEVLKMESQVLNFLHFKLSVPTTKTFLRRFLQAAQVSSKVPCLELELLANYLAELTLVEYSFLEFLPSLIAASAVFLAKWTLDQSEHPWNATLEHYSSYNALELRAIVLAMHDLQLNTSGCSLNAIREKYKQQKFNCVATLSASSPVRSLF
ncbi:cyclin-A2-1-like [Malania oleifera]|uniref:cyclin-A2-1-like n=1 Tax=Malania oleifera TaxID=397392 RepID=UPI0025AE387A|nr:cyclin-A2-1-like [Malania oleifera]XP_057959363.1 cyclin-A2-1-like [Malania oleifera]